MAKKANDARKMVTLICTECKSKNYRTSRNVKTSQEKLKLNKYCNTCRKTVEHKQEK